MIVHKRGGRVKRGHGIFDNIKPAFNIIKSIATNPATPGIIKSGVEIGKNTKNIIDAIRKKHPPVEQIIDGVNNVQHVIERIKKLRAGTGCKCHELRRSNSTSFAATQLRRSGKGFHYI